MKPNTKTIAFALIALLGSYASHSQQRLKLDSILSTIKQNSPMLQEYRYKAEALNEISKGAKAGWLNGGLGHFHDSLSARW